MDREEITEKFLVELFASNQLNNIISECIERTRRSNKKRGNKSYGFDLIKYLGGGIHYAIGQYTHNVKINRNRIPLSSYQSYSPEGSDRFFFPALGYFDVPDNIVFDGNLPNVLMETNKELGFDTRPIGIMGTVYEKENIPLLLWQSISEHTVSKEEVDEIMNLSIGRMKENPAIFFERYDIPAELRGLPTRDPIEKAVVLELCYSYALAEGLRQGGYNASVLRFNNGKPCPEDLKTLGQFAFEACPTQTSTLDISGNTSRL